LKNKLESCRDIQTRRFYLSKVDMCKHIASLSGVDCVHCGFADSRYISKWSHDLESLCFYKLKAQRGPAMFTLKNAHKMYFQ